MPRAGLLLAFAFRAVVHAEDAEFQDTPLLSSLWEATKNGNNDAIDRLLDTAEHGITARASDGRGLAWWAWEFQNTYALGAILAHGGDVLSTDEDLQGQPAVQMCTDNPDCEKDALVEKAKSLVEDIKTRKEQREKARDEDAEFDVDAEDEVGDDEF
mmetsp:Transcript_90477/g.292870  ORF Transcript_90477/g.292870 Transcript_90477/m.292870 type:complete len:157 (-) Transcript_90477:132-602(-)